MRILHVIRPTSGGMRVYLRALLKGAGEMRIETGVASPSGELNEEALSLGAASFFTPIGDRPGPGDLSAILSLNRVVKEFSPDLLHCHGLTAAWIGRFVGRRRRVPVIVTYHNTLDAGSRPRRAATIAIERLMSRWNAHSIAVSAHVGRDIRRRLLLPADKVTPILNGIDLERVKPSSTRFEMRRRLSIPQDAFVVGSIGRLVPQKDIPTLLAAASEVMAAASQAFFLLVGDGPLRAFLERVVRESGLSGRVIFLGRRADVADLLQAMDAFALSSRYEGACLAAMEAMAAGLPVVSTSIGCLLEFVLPEHGILVPPGDSHALANGLLSLIRRPDLRDAMGEQARIWAKKNLDQNRMIAATCRVYDNVMEQGGAGRLRVGQSEINPT